MALETKLYQKLTQHLVMTHQLQQAIKLLQMARHELQDLVSQEMLENPVLEELANEEPTAPKELEENDRAEEIEKPESGMLDIVPTERIGEIDWKDYIENYPDYIHDTTTVASTFEASRVQTRELLPAKELTLADHLSWQMQMSDFTEEELRIGDWIVGNLDQDGYLRGPVDQIAEALNVAPARVEEVLKRVQELDPVGVGARDLPECLLIQLAYFRLEDKLPGQLVKHHLSNLENRHYEKIARELGASLAEIEAAAKLIRGLDPKPGRNFDQSETRYITPDVFVYKVDDDYQVVVNDEGIPRLTISPFYRQLLAHNSQPERETKEFLREKVRSATWLIKSIHQRQRTLYRVTQSIFTFQREFLDLGIDGLKPLILRDVASDLGMHESTISRATTNKYVHTPLGTFELKYFFNNGFRCRDGESVSAERVKEKVREIIHRENGGRPMSDRAIADLLSTQNIPIARRTVAKYREELRLLPSSKRKSAAS